MAFGFNTGAIWFDRYMEAYYEVIATYYKALGKIGGFNYYEDIFKASVLPAIKEAVRSTKGAYKSEYLDKYYTDMYEDYFSNETLGSIFAGIDISGIEVEKIIAKWGFDVESDNLQEGAYIQLRLPRKFGRSADNIIDYHSNRPKFGLNSNDWGFKADEFSFQSVSSRKSLRKSSRSDNSFIYYEPKGWLYFNENGEEKGYGIKGGLCAIFPGNPSLSDNSFILM